MITIELTPEEVSELICDFALTYARWSMVTAMGAEPRKALLKRLEHLEAQLQEHGLLTDEHIFAMHL